jgi:hypothetical protein
MLTARMLQTRSWSFALCHRRIQAEHVSVVRELMEFYYREGITSEVSARWNGGAACRRKKRGRILF